MRPGVRRGRGGARPLGGARVGGGSRTGARLGCGRGRRFEATDGGGANASPARDRSARRDRDGAGLGLRDRSTEHPERYPPGDAPGGHRPRVPTRMRAGGREPAARPPVPGHGRAAGGCAEPQHRGRFDCREGRARPADGRAGQGLSRLRLGMERRLRDAEHAAARERLGVTPHHRRSFAPVARRLETGE